MDTLDSLTKMGIRDCTDQTRTEVHNIAGVWNDIRQSPGIGLLIVTDHLGEYPPLGLCAPSGYCK